VKQLKVLVLVALAMGARPARAQIVVQPEANLTPTQTSVRDALYQLRDSLRLVEAATARIARDRSVASDAALRSRARVVANRCTAAVSQLDSTQSVVTQHSLPDPDPKAVRPALARALTELRGRLTQCAAQFTDLTRPAKSEELRDYGIGRGQRVEEAIQRYRPSVQRYFSAALGQQYWPNLTGAGATPSAN
jgi:hypothetical protein